MFFIPNLHQLSSRLFKLLATVLLVSLVAAYTYARSVNPPKNYLLSAGERLPWEHESSNPRVQDHLAAARFLTQLNFYEDGHGLVLPPSITRERLEASYSVEQLAEVSGLVHDDGRLYGLTEERVGSVDVLVAGCAACHIGKAAGRVIPGLGNKTFDIFGLAQATHQDIESASKFDSAMHVGNKDWERAHQAGQKSFLNLLNHPEYDSGTAGAITQYFAAAMAFEEMGMEPFETPLYAPAKAPILWGYGPKRRVGVFADGSLKGKPAGAAGVPLFIGNYSLDLYEKNMDTYEAAEQQFEKLLPPEYPFEIDRSITERGETVFKNNCVQCHGQHDRDHDDLPIYVDPQFIGLDEVGTDEVRAKVYDDEVRQRVSESPLASYIQPTENREGYIAPNLWGVWSRFPYLHNGSVANMQDLLTPPEDRPTYINLVDIGEEHRFDQQRLGATPTDQVTAAERAQNKDRWVLNASRKGLGNGGHDFGTDLEDADKRALIEYLKTL